MKQWCVLYVFLYSYSYDKILMCYNSKLCNMLEFYGRPFTPNSHPLPARMGHFWYSSLLSLWRYLSVSGKTITCMRAVNPDVPRVPFSPHLSSPCETSCQGCPMGWNTLIKVSVSQDNWIIRFAFETCTTLLQKN